MATITTDERLQLLSKPNWNYKDIARYFDLGITKASEIKKAARKASGGFPKYLQDYVTAKSVFELMGLELDEEIARIKSIKEAENGGFAAEA